MCQENLDGKQSPQLVMIEKKRTEGECQGRCREEGADKEAQRAKCHGKKEDSDTQNNL